MSTTIARTSLVDLDITDGDLSLRLAPSRELAHPAALTLADGPALVAVELTFSELEALVETGAAILAAADLAHAVIGSDPRADAAPSPCADCDCGLATA
ncbi:hypothetical protein SEA_IAMGROOT_67 [Microbacterium phage IAmGroot]|uniref:Uncharacterized protein n=1 Tax=Microbacterium phage IAmGroot TaxID=2588486 RepID=A0A4Y6EAZ7_9CAUD|nr:hypothetical protein SEA_IAMGROOT_67 [Microbacterium phage IAmGroot]